MTSNIGPLGGRYKGRKAYIVGGGPSLRYLNESYLGRGPIICINQSVYVVQKLNITNQIYELLQDACENGPGKGHDCKYPKLRDDVILILSQDEKHSRWCLPDHPNKYYADWVKDFSAPNGSMSIEAAIKLAKHMGCDRIDLLCCDSLSGDLRSYLVQDMKVTYRIGDPKRFQRGAAMAMHGLKYTPHRIIIPKKHEVGDMGLDRTGCLRLTMLDLQKRFGLNNFIETGTFLANTTEWASKHFERVWTIEVFRPYWEKAFKKFKSNPNVTCVLSDSRRGLPEVLKHVDEPALIWLDAHWNGTKGRDYDCPILDELREIKQQAAKHVVMIDDASLFDYWEKWPSLEMVMDELKEYDTEIKDDAIIAIPKRED